MTIKVGLKRMEFGKSKAHIDEAGAIDALVKARSAILDGQLRQSSKSPGANTFRQRASFQRRLYRLSVSRPLSVIR